MFNLIGNLFILAGVFFIGFGIFGILKFKDFYARILIASKVDTVGFMSIMIGIIFKQGISFFSLKVMLILVSMIIINPVMTHTMARSAFVGQYENKETGE
jgi:multicomponent Na+:H+ antiporter subunit G